jgi:hypothetical protein
MDAGHPLVGALPPGRNILHDCGGKRRASRRTLPAGAIRHRIGVRCWNCQRPYALASRSGWRALLSFLDPVVGGYS